RVAVTEEERAVPHPVVDVLVAVDVPLAAAAGALDVDGKRQMMADIVGHAAGNGPPRALGERGRLGVLRPVFFDDRHRWMITPAPPILALLAPALPAQSSPGGRQ